MDKNAWQNSILIGNNHINDGTKIFSINLTPLPTISGSIFAKIVGMAVDKKPEESDIEGINIVPSPSPNNVDDETDTDFHESLPKEILKIKDITFRTIPFKKKSSVEFKTDDIEKSRFKDEDKGLKVSLETVDDRTEKKAILEKQKQDRHREEMSPKTISKVASGTQEQVTKMKKKLNKKQTSGSSNQSKQSDSIGSVIPVITISTTESDEELLQFKNNSKSKNKKKGDDDQNSEAITECLKNMKKSSSDLKSLRRQSSVDSINEQKLPKEKIPDDGHKYQYSL